MPRSFLSGWIPLPNITAAGYNYLSPASSAPTNQDQYISRVDQNFSERDTLSVSYMYDLSQTIPSARLRLTAAATVLARKT